MRMSEASRAPSPAAVPRETGQREHRGPIRSRVVASLTTLSVGTIILGLVGAFFVGRYGSFGWFLLSTLGIVLALTAIGVLAVMSIAGHPAWQRQVSLVATLLCLTAIWIWALMDGRARTLDLGLRVRISSEVGLDKLQSWAVNLISKVGGNLDERNYMLRLDPRRGDYERLVPDSIGRLSPYGIYVLAPGYGERYVDLGWRYLETSWGVRVGSSTFRPVHARAKTHRWRAGVYSYQYNM